VKIVNGYVCQTSCDVTVAKKGIDPRNPHDDPVKQAQIDAAKGVQPDNREDAVVFGGALEGLVSRRRGDVAPVVRALDLLA
jgi:hypothetical protein